MSGEGVALEPGLSVDAGAIDLGLAAVPDAQVASGAPRTGSVGLDETGAVRLGVWAMTRGAMFDVEADEVFVVLSGRATVEFLEPSLPTAEIGPGTIMRLAAGMRTRWTVHDDELRKVYVLE